MVKVGVVDEIFSVDIDLQVLSIISFPVINISCYNLCSTSPDRKYPKSTR